MSEQNKSPDEIKVERGQVYGEPHHSHKNIGLAWTALIQQHYGITLDHPIPHWLVELMMVQFKTQRAARVFHRDNYDDLANYAEFARHGQEHPGEPFIVMNSAVEAAKEKAKKAFDDALVRGLEQERENLRKQLAEVIVRNRTLIEKYEGT
jgi:hypothetical protein